MLSRIWRRRLAVLTVPLAVGAALSVLHAAPASAYVGTISVDADTEANNDGDTTEEVTAECPSGSTLIGAGWAGLYSNGVIVDEVEPDVSAGTVRVEAWEGQNGTPNSWSVQARAICADGVTNVEVVDDGPSAFDSTSPKSDTATCPFGKSVVGVGYEIGGATGQVRITAVDPSEEQVEVTAYEDDDGTSSSWSAVAYAVCATEPLGLEFVDSPSPARGSDTTTCPNGKVALGGGASLTAAFNDVAINGVKIGTYGLDFALATGREDVAYTTSAWATAAEAICAYP